MKKYNRKQCDARDFILESFRRSEWSKCEQVRGVHYKSDCCSALHAIPPVEDSKYARVYYFTKLHHAQTNISNGEVKLSSFDGVNDLFEIYPFIEVNEEDRSCTDNRRELARAVADKNVFLSTTLDWGSPVMWSHYADEHKGVCLGFDILKDHLKPISYVSNRGLIRNKLLESIDEDILLIKNNAWEYENEYRVILRKGNDHVFEKEIKEGSGIKSFFLKTNLTDFSIKEVIFGLNVNQEDMENFTDKLRDHLSEVTVIQARKSSHEYKMVPNSILDRKFEPYFFGGDFGVISYKETFNKSDICNESCFKDSTEA